jgi:hypothetical protein
MLLVAFWLTLHLGAGPSLEMDTTYEPPPPASASPPVVLSDPAAQPPTSIAPEYRLPDLEVLPPFDLYLRHNARTGGTHLRLAITFWNDGRGPLELHGQYNPILRRTMVVQTLYSEGDRAYEHFAGDFIWHPGHDHWHFANFALYELWSLSADGGLNQVVATSGKVTFCILETDIMDAQRPDFSRRRRFAVCGPGLQGLSVGWGDTYDAHLDGQMVDITGLPSGVYALVVKVDPANRLQESDDTNNSAVTYIRLAEGSLVVLGGEEQMWRALDLCARRC